MDHALRDPIWQFVGAAISLVALLVAVAAIRIQQQRKALGYHLSSDRPVLYLFDRGLKDRLVLTLDGNPVQGLSTFEVSIFNHGNVPVLPSDFFEPLSISFPPPSKVLAVAVTDSTPENLGVTTEGTEGDYRISPVLLNPGDEFVIQFLVDHAERSVTERPAVAGRVAGVKSLERRSSRPAPRYKMGYYRFLLARATPIFILGVAASAGASKLFELITSYFR